MLLDVFKLDPDFLENEEKYKTIKRGENKTKLTPAVKYFVFTVKPITHHLLTEILDEGSSDSGGEDNGSDDDEDDEDVKEEEGEGKAGEKSNHPLVKTMLNIDLEINQTININQNFIKKITSKL